MQPAVYIAESAFSSGSAGSSSDGSGSAVTVSAGIAAISVAAASLVLLLVGKNPPQMQTTVDYSGPSLSYYINKFKSAELVQASVPTEPEASPPVQPEISAPEITGWAFLGISSGLSLSTITTKGRFCLYTTNVYLFYDENIYTHGGYCSSEDILISEEQKNSFTWMENIILCPFYQIDWWVCICIFWWMVLFYVIHWLMQFIRMCLFWSFYCLLRFLEINFMV